MNENSLMVYFNPENQKRWNSLKSKIVRKMDSLGVPVSVRTLSEISGWDDVTVRKRMSELFYSGHIIVTGNTTENGNPNSMYSLVKNEPKAVNKNRKIDQMYNLLLELAKEKDEEKINLILKNAKTLL